ncbi:hypothetical protein EDC04DRAFT_2601072 [Pisolithus marmoratus]|nr:hypothetical protein EDC04DRAFT_2601072 [Pisolithus marmoratus]
MAAFSNVLELCKDPEGQMSNQLAYLIDRQRDTITKNSLWDWLKNHQNQDTSWSTITRSTDEASCMRNDIYQESENDHVMEDTKWFYISYTWDYCILYFKLWQFCASEFYILKGKKITGFCQFHDLQFALKGKPNHLVINVPCNSNGNGHILRPHALGTSLSVAGTGRNVQPDLRNAGPPGDRKMILRRGSAGRPNRKRSLGLQTLCQQHFLYAAW